ncbi:MAG TPA: hypothetical protein VMU50_05190 [Polyangia bacterium]|nr:hypothetical protein [Polyangia bacterium]
MDVSNVTSGVGSIFGTTAVGSQTNTDATTSTDSVAGVSVDISKPGQLFGQLSSLASSDPAKFKQVTADIAQKLKDAAGSQDGKRADFLNQLSDKFTAASQSGSAADLAPQRAQGHHGGHGHHHRHAQGAEGGGGGGTGNTSGQTGGDSGNSVFQTIESIISDALDGASS